MGSDLNQYFVTFKVFKDAQQVHELECPKSLIQDMMNIWKYPGSPYTVHVVDHTGNFRFNSDALNQFVYTEFN